MTFDIRYQIPPLAFGTKKWWFCHGGWAKAKWMRIAGLLVFVSMWKKWPVEFSFGIEYQKTRLKVIGMKQHAVRIG